MKKNDSKYFYSAELMNQALLSLLEKKDIEFITVTEITKKAGVNRSTFYLHYENIYDLLEETIENLNKQFLQAFASKAPFAIQSKKSAFFITEEYLTPYLEFCKAHKRILKLVRAKPQLFRRNDAYQKMYNQILYPAISQFVRQETERIYQLEFFTCGVVGIIDKWLALDCAAEIKELIKIIKTCVGYESPNPQAR